RLFGFGGRRGGLRCGRFALGGLVGLIGFIGLDSLVVLVVFVVLIILARLFDLGRFVRNDRGFLFHCRPGWRHDGSGRWCWRGNDGRGGGGGLDDGRRRLGNFASGCDGDDLRGRGALR